MSLMSLPPCPVCSSDCRLHDVVDFNKSCQSANGRFLPLLGIPIYYALCETCGFCFSPDMCQWSTDDFSAHVYNDDYKLVDPDYEVDRPTANAAFVSSLFPGMTPDIRHLDYGGGNGQMASILRSQGGSCVSYDPFADGARDPMALGPFDLITAFEVFEHVTDVGALMSRLVSLRAEDGIILFSTLTSDGHIHAHQRLDWWYASPRNGHISLFSKTSLSVLATRYSFNFGTLAEGVHVFWKKAPPFAAHLFG